MGTKLNVVTGATGLLGSHIVAALTARGESVRALVRPTSDQRFLRGLGVELLSGDLHDRDSLARAFAGADTVYHSASHVGDWGPRHVFQREVVDTTRNVLDAAANARRVLYVSSIAVYGHPRHSDPITEETPTGRQLYRTRDYYSRAKIAAEKMVFEAGPRGTIVRPSLIIGPRDRTILPHLVAAAQRRWLSVVGSGNNFLNVVPVENVADAAIRAANAPAAGGRAYNISSEGELTQREFFDMLTSTLALPAVRRRYPFWFAHLCGLLGEAVGTVIGMKRSPYITRHSVGLLSRPTVFSTTRAREELGWTPQVGAREAWQRALEWWTRKGEILLPTAPRETSNP